MGMFDLIRLLEAHHVDFVLVGGLAVTLHGFQRLTMDVDVVVAMDPDNVQRLIGAARAAGLQPVVPLPLEVLADGLLLNRLLREKGMLAFALRHPRSRAAVLDVLIQPVVPFAELRAAALLVDLGGCGVPVASLDHLIIMKEAAGRGKDVVDLEALRAIRAGEAADG